MTGEDIYDVIIVGGGPAGLSAALYASRARLKTIVLDKNPAAGALAYAREIENYPGVADKMPGADLLDRFRAQAESFGADIVKTQVMGADLSAARKQVMTADGVYTGKTVIVATGNMGRKPSLPGEAEFLGRGVSYCATCDAAFFRGKDVAVTGKLDEIAVEIDALTRFVRKLYVITATREPTPEQLADLDRYGLCETLTGHRVKEILGTDTVTGVRIAGPEGDERELDIAGIFIFLRGSAPIVDFLFGALDTSGDGCILADRNDMSTSIEGVYAVGDVTCKQIRQIVVATSEGCIASLSAEKFINNRERHKPQWS